MNFKLFLLILTISLTTMAKTDPELTKLVLKQCSYEIYPDENDQIDCVTDIVNCAIGSGGKTDLTKIAMSCLNKRMQVRKTAQQ